MKRPASNSKRWLVSCTERRMKAQLARRHERAADKGERRTIRSQRRHALRSLADAFDAARAPCRPPTNPAFRGSTLDGLFTSAQPASRASSRAPFGPAVVTWRSNCGTVRQSCRAVGCDLQERSASGKREIAPSPSCSGARSVLRRARHGQHHCGYLRERSRFTAYMRIGRRCNVQDSAR